MAYKYEKGIINYNHVEEFSKYDNFVGFILPDGSIYKCKNHNVSNIDTVVHMYLDVLQRHFDDKDKILDTDTTDKILKMIIYYFKKASLEQIKALSNFIEKENLFISDLLVQFFGCHSISRINGMIYTSETNHEIFYNYLLNGVKVFTVDKIVYDEEKKEYRYLKAKDRNDYIYDEINRLKKDVNNDEIELFYK